jgi:hypothetical protein
MAVEIALAVSFEIQPPDPAAAGDRILPYPGMHRAALPGDIPRKPDIHRQ